MKQNKKLIKSDQYKLILINFIYRCEKALKQNKKLIKSDQSEYQLEMERNCKKMAAQLRPLVSDRTIIYKINNLHRLVILKKYFIYIFISYN